MHIVIGILSAILTILYILDRVGIDVGALNPWSWRRRRAWAKRYHGDPIYSVDDPIQAAAIFITGTARLGGGVSAEEKRVILGLFEEKFSLNARDASELFGSAMHLLGAPQVIDTQLDGLAGRTRDLFTPEQAESILEMLRDIAALDGGSTAKQNEYITRLRAALVKPEPVGSWASRKTSV